MPGEEYAVFQIAKIVDIIRIRKFERVVLQFPDELLRCSVSIYSLFRDTLRATHFFIVADSTYASSVDEISARHIQCDFIVSFGDDLSSSGSVPVLVVPALKYLDVREVIPRVTSAMRCIESDYGLSARSVHTLDIQLLYEPGFHHVMESLVVSACKELQLDKSMVKIATLPSCADVDKWYEHCTDSSGDTKLGDNIGGLYLVSPAENTVEYVENNRHSHGTVTTILGQRVLWYIGDKKKQLMNIMLRLGNTPIVAYFPSSGIVQTMKGQESREFMERYGGVSKVRDAEIVGIIVGSMGLNETTTRALIQRLEKLIRSAGKKHYTFIMGRLNEAKLCNFPEVDIYCLLCNEDDAVIKPKTFHVPVITPYELELGLGAHAWSSTYLSTFSHVYGEMDVDMLVNEVLKNRPEDASEKESEDHLVNAGKMLSREMINIEEKRMVESFQSAAADRLILREYQGMEFEIPSGSSKILGVNPGKFGIASEYCHSSDNLC